MTKNPNIIRQKILLELEKRDMTINALGVAMHEQGRMSREMVHKYLSGKNDIASARAADLLRYLKLI